MSRFFRIQRVNRELMKMAWKNSKFFRLSFILAWVFWLMVLVTPLLRLLPGAEQGLYIPLHYNVFFGVDKFGPWYSVFQLPAFGLMVLFFNIYLSIRFFEQELVLSKFFIFLALLIQIMLLAAMYFTVLLNM